MARPRLGAAASFAVRVSDLVYAALLVVAYPRPFRRVYGTDMRETFRDRCTDRLGRRGLSAMPGLWATTLADLARHGGASRLPGEGGRFPRRRSGALTGDLAFAVRSLRKSPGFTVVALVTLALGIGANTAVYTVIDAALLADLPFPDADELFMVWRYDIPASDRTAFSYPDIRDIQAEVRTFSALAPFDIDANIVADGVDGRRVAGAAVPEAFFEVLGVPPLLGRAIRADDEAPGSERVAVLGYSLWGGRFGGDPGIVGEVIRIDSRPATVVGVMPEGFSFPPGTEVWTPLPPDERRSSHWLRAIGRVAPPNTAAQAEAEVAGLIARLEEEYPGRYQNNSARLVPLREQFVADLRPTLMILLLAVGAVLLIGCANLANLLLARSGVRRREIAVRSALGAGRGRILRQLLTESLVLSLMGGTLGVVVAYGGTRLLDTFVPSGLAPVEATVDLGVLGFSLGLAVLTGLLFGLIPAFRAAAVELSESLRAEARGATSGRASVGGRRALIVAEVAIAVTLLIGAGLMMRSMAGLLGVDVGFDSEDVWVLGVDVPVDETASDFDSEREDARVVGFFRELRERVEALPEVSSAGEVAFIPLGGAFWGSRTMVEGQPVVPRPERYLGSWNAATPGYFETMGIPLVRGRLFDDRDGGGGELVALINETLARDLWPDGGDPIGARITNQEPDSDLWFTVIGIVGDVRTDTLVSQPVGQIYVTHAVTAWSGMQLVVKTRAGASVAGPFRTIIADLDPGLTVAEMRPMSFFVERHRSQTRFLTALLGAFSGLAMALAAVGIYGVISYAVSQRHHELGVRRALGAQGTDVVRLVIGSGVTLAVVGVVIGLAASWALRHVVETMLFEVSPADPITYAFVATLALAVALVACFIPASRAGRIDPVVALRHE